jgi:predicted dehydrogenase
MIFLIVGLGSIAQKHIHALKVLYPDCEIYALRSGSKGINVEKVRNIYHLSELPIKPNLVIISNPTNQHFQTILDILPLDVPLLIEKPLFDKLDNIDLILNQIRERNIQTYIGCNLRFHPGIQFLKNYIERNQSRINEVNIYCGSFLPDWRPGRDFRQIYSAIKEQGGGVHLDLIHEIDYCTWIFGFPLKSSSIFRNNSSLQISAFDYAQYSLEYENFVTNITLNYYRRDSKRTIEILFENETWTLDIPTSTIKNHLGEIIFSENFRILDTYELQLKYLMGCLEKKEEIMNSIEEAANVLKICLKNE